jgi:hypothetical protein
VTSTVQQLRDLTERLAAVESSLAEAQERIAHLEGHAVGALGVPVGPSAGFDRRPHLRPAETDSGPGKC